MAWYKVKVSKLQFISMFGYNVLEENNEFIIAEWNGKSYIIDKSNPWLEFDDNGEAMQLGVDGVIKL